MALGVNGFSRSGGGRWALTSQLEGAALPWNGWQLLRGLGGRLGLEYANSHKTLSLDRPLFLAGTGQNIAFPYHRIWVVWVYENYR